jgi:hypothetical protein
MKKLFLLLVTAATLSSISCTEQQRARHYGAHTEIQVNPGYKLLEVTWKDDDLWMFIEEMDSDYVPKTKIFKEESSFGIIEGSITFKESRKND